MATQDREDAPTAHSRSRAAGSDGRHVDESSSDLDRVREILFGERVREQDRRLEALRDELVLQLQGHRESAKERMDEMEAQWRSEMSALEKKLGEVSSKSDDERSRLEARLSAEIAALSTRMESGLRELESAGNTALLDLAKRLEKENADLRAELGARSAELTENKADRTVLSELLTDLASRLNDRPSDESQGS